ncbi:hypothetical protein L198_08173 [Cryptococcus wingfieldii CBS 7118]|uniref:Uncharacterized protein n=1 Tax=Cryptococcus wingfieldii CBS 7118 TaxID=1295528 RepID=A0A1E3HF85_9TREE|nr:hypothetical protein L198_08173 [Cryptococcus wingfieldii CBS 7118]ODN74987.1 hypothetical protein L198_08173 [Cryptococcus wingfieldii CBS 7118]
MPSRSRSLGAIFSEPGFAEVLEAIFHRLILRDTLALIRVNRNTRNVFKSSSHLQYTHLCRKHSSLPPSAAASRHPPSARLIKELAERERRLEEITPVGSSTYRLSSRVIAFEQGLIVAECDTKAPPLGFEDPPPEYMDPTGWEIIRVPNAELDKDSEMRGGIKRQDHWTWRTDYGGYCEAVACVEDNVAMVIKQWFHGETLSRVEFFFYQLLPPLGTPPPEDGNFDPIIHPDARIPCIQVVLPAAWPQSAELSHYKLCPEGRLAVQFEAGRDLYQKHPSGRGRNDLMNKEIFAVIWDWKAGVCLGQVPLFPDISTDFSGIYPVGPFCVTATHRKVPSLKHPELYESVVRPYTSFSTEADEDGYLTQFSLDFHTLLPLPLAFPPEHHSQDSTGTEPHTWRAGYIPYCLPLVSFDLPFEASAEFGTDVYSIWKDFYVVGARYKKELHNGDLRGLLLFTCHSVDAPTNVVDLNFVLRHLTKRLVEQAQACLSGAGLHLPLLSVFAMPTSTPDVSRLTRVEQTEWASSVLTMSTYANNLNMRGVWSPSSVIHSDMPELVPYLPEMSHIKLEDYPGTAEIRPASMEGCNPFSGEFGAREVKVIELGLEMEATGAIFVFTNYGGDAARVKPYAGPRPDDPQDPSTTLFHQSFGPKDNPNSITLNQSYDEEMETLSAEELGMVLPQGTPCLPQKSKTAMMWLEREGRWAYDPADWEHPAFVRFDGSSVIYDQTSVSVGRGRYDADRLAAFTVAYPQVLERDAPEDGDAQVRQF